MRSIPPELFTSSTKAFARVPLYNESAPCVATTRSVLASLTFFITSPACNSSPVPGLVNVFLRTGEEIAI